ncbi:MAG: hypothetical protein AAF399_07555 [Bacteroidota bacterium]
MNIRTALPRLFEILSRGYVWCFLNLYGWGKMLGGQFHRRGKLPAEIAQTPLGEIGAYDLAWTFMGYSHAYILFIGISQVVGAWMLLWNRTKLLGVAILFPIMVNILVFDAIFLETKGAMVNAGLYTLMLLYILYHNRSAVQTAFLSLTRQTETTSLLPEKRIQQVLVLIGLAGLVFGLDQLFVNLVGH